MNLKKFKFVNFLLNVKKFYVRNQFLILSHNDNNEYLYLSRNKINKIKKLYKMVIFQQRKSAVDWSLLVWEQASSRGLTPALRAPYILYADRERERQFANLFIYSALDQTKDPLFSQVRPNINIQTFYNEWCISVLTIILRPWFILCV